MRFKGRVEHGRIVLNDPVELPEGAGVFVEIPTDLNGKPLHADILRFSGILPADVDIDQARYEAIIDEHGCADSAGN